VPDLTVVGEFVRTGNACERGATCRAKVLRASLAEPRRRPFLNLRARSLEHRGRQGQAPRHEICLRVPSIERDDLSRTRQLPDRSIDVAHHEPGLDRSNEPGAADLGKRIATDGTRARGRTSARHQAWAPTTVRSATAVVPIALNGELPE